MDWTALAIFAATYVVLALGYFPGLRIDRTGAAVVGASLTIGAGILTFDEAMRAIDHRTILLLFGMMIVVANLKLAGFFRVVAAWVVRHAHGPSALLAGVVATAGVLSAFFVNDTVCLVMTPLILEVALTLRRNPVPYLLAVAMGSNAGSTATITGNPQNMMIGSLSRIPYTQFAAALAPVAAIALLIVFLVLRGLYRAEFRGARFTTEEIRVRVNRALLWKSLLIAVGMLAAFFAGSPVAETAMVAGALLLITRRVKPEKVYHDIDWSLLVLFAGLFIVTAGVEKTHLPERLFEWARPLGLHTIAGLTAVSAALSNLVSNVPAVLVFRPLLSAVADPTPQWLALAMSSTLAGNLTIIGSVANLIVIERARRHAPVSFTEYAKAGVPVTLLSLLAGALWLDWWL